MAGIKDRYTRIEIPLDTPEHEKEIFISGDYLSVISITGIGTCVIKLDHRHSQEINLREVSEISGFYERIFLTTDGGGGIVSLFIGTGLALHLAPNPEKLINGFPASTQLTTLTDVVYPLAASTLLLKDVTILNMHGMYSCYVGPYVENVTSFREHAYFLLPHHTLKFTTADMYAFGCVSYDGVHNVTLSIIGTHE